MRLATYIGKYREFVVHVATMMSGKGLAAAIALFTTPIIARIFDPNLFGIAAVFASIVGITSNVASLRYTAAIVIPTLDTEAWNMLRLSFRITFAFCLLMLLVIAGLELGNIEIAALSLLQTWVWLLPLGTFLEAATSIQESWLVRCKKFRTIATSMVVGNSVTSGSRIAMGIVAAATAFQLILGQMLGEFLRYSVQSRGVRPDPGAKRERLGVDGMRFLAAKYADFPKLNAPAALVFSLGQNLPVLAFGAMYSPTVAGLYAMAMRLAKVPVTIGATAIRSVFLQKASSIHNSGRTLQKAFLLTLGGLAAIGFIPALLVGFYGQTMLSWLLGSNWTAAGRYLEILAPWMFMIWISSPCNAVFVVLRKQKIWLGLQVGVTILRLLALGVAFGINATPEWTLWAFVSATVLGNLFTIILSARMAAKTVDPETRGSQ